MNNEDIEKIKTAIRNQERSGTIEQYDSFLNGMEYCLALLERRMPNYRKKGKE